VAAFGTGKAAQSPKRKSIIFAEALLMHSRKPLALIFAALLSPVALAQQTIVPASPAPTKVLTFEVATIKPSARTDGAWRLQSTADGYTGMDISLLTLVGEAYGIYDSKLLTGGAGLD